MYKFSRSDSDSFAYIWKKKSCPKIFLPSSERISESPIGQQNISADTNRRRKSNWGVRSLARKTLGDSVAVPDDTYSSRSRSRRTNYYDNRNPPTSFNDIHFDSSLDCIGDTERLIPRGRSAPARDRYSYLSKETSNYGSRNPDKSFSDEYSDTDTEDASWRKRNGIPPSIRKRNPHISMVENDSFSVESDSSPKHDNPKGAEDWYASKRRHRGRSRTTRNRNHILDTDLFYTDPYQYKKDAHFHELEDDFIDDEVIYSQKRIDDPRIRKRREYSSNRGLGISSCLSFLYQNICGSIR
jgi:hypothetical protein